MPDERNRLNQLRADALDVCTNVGVHPFEVELIVWPPMFGDVGHTAIRIGNLVLGYYPTDQNEDGSYGKLDLHSSPGDLHVDTLVEAAGNYDGQEICVFALSLDCSQIIMLIDYYVALLMKPGTYSLFFRNCTTVAVEALTQAGFDLTDTVDLPTYSLGDFRRSYPGQIKVLDPGLFTSTVRFDAQGIISPGQIKPRTRTKPFVIQVTEEIVGQNTGAGQ